MKTYVVVLLHIIFWVLVGFLYYLFWDIASVLPQIENQGVKQLFGKSIFSISRVLEIFNFYLFYFVFTPKYIVEKKISKFFLWGAISSLILPALRIFLHELFLDDLVGKQFFYFFYLPQFILLGICGSIMRIFINWFTDSKEKQKLEKKNLQTELALLKSQISPHFLFNTLNNIDVLITKDAEKASVYLKKLSDILRFMLYETKGELIPLNMELEYIKKYIELQKIRTSNQSFVFFSKTGRANGLNIAPMIFIPFVENAFKHSSNKKTNDSIKIRIDISSHSIKFCCENFKNKNKSPIHKQSGLGISLIEQRLNLLYKNKHTLKINNSNEKYFVVLTIQLNATSVTTDTGKRKYIIGSKAG